MVVLRVQVGNTLSTVASAAVTVHTLESPESSTLMLKDSMEEPLFSIVSVTLVASPG